MQWPDTWWDDLASRYSVLTRRIDQKRAEFPQWLTRIERIRSYIHEHVAPESGGANPLVRLNDPIGSPRQGHNRHHALHEVLGDHTTREWMYQNHPQIDLSLATVLEVHRRLYAGQSPMAGRLKRSEIYVLSSILSDRGRPPVMIPTVPPDRTAEVMRALHDGLNTRWSAGRVDHVLVAAAYCVDLFGIHPFADGNGRTGRHMFVLMLLKAGHRAVPWLNLHGLFDARRLAYLQAAQRSMYKPGGDLHDPLPLMDYLSELLASAYDELEARLDRLEAALFA